MGRGVIVSGITPSPLPPIPKPPLPCWHVTDYFFWGGGGMVNIYILEPWGGGDGFRMTGSLGLQNYNKNLDNFDNTNILHLML